MQTIHPPFTTRALESERQVTARPQWAFFQGRVVPIADAKVSIMTQVVNYGIGAFGGIRGYWNDDAHQLYVFRIADHFRRLLNSCKLFNTTLPYSHADLGAITLDLIRREDYRQDMYARPLVYNATEDITPRLYDVEFDFCMFTRPQGNYIKLEVRACTSSWRRLDDNMLPARGKITGGYVNSAFARSEAHWNGYDEGIVLNQDGHVAEGSAENLFIVRDGQVYTPPVTDNILEGITRSTLMQLFRDELGVAVRERQIDRSELYVADEALFCGTGAQVAGIVEIDHRVIGAGRVGPLTQKLQDVYFRVVRGKHPGYMNWLTPVYSR
ncbi:MAG: branched-chain amino acid transaminase [Chloroflexi bacterium]|nr:branched-chain amino acid transaminase [Chloroflexota bacterium]